MRFDFELCFWIVATIAGLITFGVLWVLAKRDAENYVDWVRENRIDKK